MKDHIARWLGYHTELTELRQRLVRLQNARDYHHQRHARLQTQHEKLGAGLSRACGERDQWIGCYSRLEAATREACVLLGRARHTMNINPVGARAQLDQAMRLLKGEA